VSGHAEGAGGDLFGAGAAALATAVADSGARVVGYERGWLPHGVLAGEGVDLNATLAAMRRSKDADELALIREALRVAAAGHRAARSTIRPGVSELDVFNAIQAAMTLEIGGFATDRVIRAGDVMIIDTFPIVNGYRADFTATIAATPDVSDNQRRLDTALHEAMAAAEARLRAGTVAGDVYRAVRGTLEAHGFAAYFPHHAGHGLGLDHPEAPYFVPDSDEVLEAGDVVTVEPGAYGDDFAARIENNYLITADGFEKLTGHDMRLIG
jgi:Xaa-Pro aminopeptidase